jgi:hypothetical protein
MRKTKSSAPQLCRTLEEALDGERKRADELQQEVRRLRALLRRRQRPRRKKRPLHFDYASPLLAFLEPERKAGRSKGSQSREEIKKQAERYIKLIKDIRAHCLKPRAQKRDSDIARAFTNKGGKYHGVVKPGSMRNRVRKALARLVDDLEKGFPSGRGPTGWDRDRALDFLTGKVK